MEVDENIISNEGSSNATYEPMNTTFMDEVTGVESKLYVVILK